MDQHYTEDTNNSLFTPGFFGPSQKKESNPTASLPEENQNFRKELQFNIFKATQKCDPYKHLLRQDSVLTSSLPVENSNFRSGLQFPVINSKNSKPQDCNLMKCPAADLYRQVSNGTRSLPLVNENLRSGALALSLQSNNLSPQLPTSQLLRNYFLFNNNNESKVDERYENLMATINSVLRKLVVTQNKLLNNKFLIEGSIYKDYTELCKKVNDKATKLYNTVDQIHNLKKENLLLDLNKLNAIVFLIHSIIAHLREKSKTNNKNTKIITILRILKLISYYEAFDLSHFLPKEDERISFQLRTTLDLGLNGFGMVISNASREHTMVNGFGTEFLLKGENTYFTVKCHDHLGRRCSKEIDDIRAVITYRNGPSFEVPLKAFRSGIHEGWIKLRNSQSPTLQVLLRGHPLPRGCFDLQTKIKSTLVENDKISKSINYRNSEFSLRKSWGICCDKDGTIYITDKEQHCVLIFDHQMRFERKFGREGTGHGQFSRPTGICVDHSKRLIIADKDNHRIQVFSTEGEFIFTFGKRGRSRTEFQYPWDVATNSRGDIAVSDSNNSKIKIFDQFGDLLCENDSQILETPRGLQFWTDDIILVSEFKYDTIYRFNLSKNRRSLSPDFMSFMRPQGNENNNPNLYAHSARLKAFQEHQRNNYNNHNMRNYAIFNPYRINFLSSLELRYPKLVSNGEFQKLQGLLCFDNYLVVATAKINQLLFLKGKDNNWESVTSINVKDFPCNMARTPDGKLLVLKEYRNHPSSVEVLS